MGVEILMDALSQFSLVTNDILFNKRITSYQRGIQLALSKKLELSQPHSLVSLYIPRYFLLLRINGKKRARNFGTGDSGINVI